MKMEIGERREALAALAMKIAPHLPEGWKVDVKLSESECENNDRVWYRFKDTALRFSIAFDSSARDLRINVASWTWPAYERRDRGEVRKDTIFPSNLYDPKEGQPDISCSAEKDPVKIAADISRRFIPEYVRIYERCKVIADKYQAHQDLTWKTWNEACALVGKDPKHNNWWNVIGPLSITNDGGDTVKIEGSVSLEILKRIKALIDEMKAAGVEGTAGHDYE